MSRGALPGGSGGPSGAGPESETGLRSRYLPSGPSTHWHVLSKRLSTELDPGPWTCREALGPARATGRCPQIAVFVHVQLEIRNLQVDFFFNLKLILILCIGTHGGTEGDGPSCWVLAPGQPACGLQVALPWHRHWRGAGIDTQCPRAPHCTPHSWGAGPPAHCRATASQPPDAVTEGPLTPGHAGAGALLMSDLVPTTTRSAQARRQPPGGGGRQVAG